LQELEIDTSTTTAASPPFLLLITAFCKTLEERSGLGGKNSGVLDSSKDAFQLLQDNILLALSAKLGLEVSRSSMN